MKLKNNVLVIGYQSASIDNLKFCLKKIYKKKVKEINVNFYNYSDINKIKKNLNSYKFNTLQKFKKNYDIILGTSEKKIEINLANYCIKNNINFFFYIDSITNLKQRFFGLIEVPKNILCLNNEIIKHLKKKIINIKKFSRITNLNMPYQNYLKKKYFQYQRKDIHLLYLTSFLGLEYEKKYILRLIKNNGENCKSLFIALHPREKIKNWIKTFRKNKIIKIFYKKNFYSNKSIKKVFGLSTLAIVNYKFAGFESYYIENKKINKSPLLELMKKYKIKNFKIV